MVWLCFAFLRGASTGVSDAARCDGPQGNAARQRRAKCALGLCLAICHGCRRPPLEVVCRKQQHCPVCPALSAACVSLFFFVPPQRWKLYFIGLHSSAPHEVDMSRIYSFDAQRQQMEAHTPRVLGAERQEDMLDPVMRIRWVGWGAWSSVWSCAELRFRGRGSGR